MTEGNMITLMFVAIAVRILAAWLGFDHIA